MKDVEIEKLREGLHVELKRSVSKLPTSFWETYSSFANTDGGTIYLGVEERKSADNLIVGVSNPEQVIKDLLTTANNRLKVSRNVLNDSDVSVIDVKGKKVISVHIRKADIREKPVYLGNNPFLSYKRLGDSDQLFTTAEILSMLNNSIPGTFDLEPNSRGIKFSDLNQESLKSYKEWFRIAHTSHPFLQLSDEEFFKHISVLEEKDGELIPSNAGVLCFGNSADIRKIYPSYMLDFQIKDAFETKWKHRLSSDDSSFSGNLYDFFQSVMSSLRPLLPAPYYLEGMMDVGREKVYLAVQEAILNAIFNADYFLPNSVRIVFDYRSITVENAGSLRIPLTLALKGGHSDPRNNGVASIFRNINLGDKAGTGIPTMFLNLREVKNLKPIYTVDEALLSTKVEILFSSALGEDDEKVLAYIYNHQEGVSTSTICDDLDLTRYQVNECLNKLMNANLIKDNGKATKGKLYFMK